MATVPSIGRADAVEPRLAPDAADATHDFYERYGKQIYRFCLRELGSREEAEDAAQTTFLNVFRGLDRGVEPEFESAWVYTIARNVCVSRKRSSFRRRRVEWADDLDTIQELVPSPSSEVDEIYGLRDALEALPEQQRRALLLREWQGLSCKEIGAELELSATAVEMLLFRARRGIVAELTAEPLPPRRRRGLRGRLRTSGDVGSIAAAIKTIFFAGGAKVAATLATVAATSVVAATPATRHEIASFVAPAARHAAPNAKATPAVNAPAPSRAAVPAAHAPAAVAAPAPLPVAHARHALHVRRAHASGPIRKAAKARKVAVAWHVPPPALHHAPAAPVAHSTSSAAPPLVTEPEIEPAAAPPAAAPADQPVSTQPVSTQPVPTQPAATQPVATQPASTQPASTQPVAPSAAVSDPKPDMHAAAPTPAPVVAGTASAPKEHDHAPKPAPATPSKHAPDPAPAAAVEHATPKSHGHPAESAPVAPAPPVTDPSATAAAPTPAPVAAAPVTAVVAPPSIGRLSPAARPVGATIEIAGSGLAGATSVTVNGVSAAFTVKSDSKLSARVPDGASNGAVVVTTPNGTATSAASFTVVFPPPSVGSLTPSSAAAGATVTIVGSHLAGATAVTFNGVAATFAVLSDSQLTAQVPATATKGSVRVTTPSGTSNGGGKFTVVAVATTSDGPADESGHGDHPKKK